MNSSTFLVKLISIPRQTKITDTIGRVEVQVQFGSPRKRRSLDHFKAIFWGSAGTDFSLYFKEGDYVIIEGILHFKRKKVKDRFEKNTQFTVFRIYPFMFMDD